MPGIDTDRVDHAIGADIVGQCADRANRALTLEIHDLGALRLRHVEPIVDGVDSEHAGSAHELGAGDGELSNRPAAEHGHDVALFDLGDVGPEIARREDVREQNGLIVADLVGKLHEVDVGEGHARLLRLEPLERSAVSGAAIEGGAGERTVRIRPVALRVIACAAIGAGATGDGRWDQHAVADPEIAHVGSHLLDDADALVPEHRPALHTEHRAAHHVQIRPANGAGRETHNRVGRLLELRL